MKSTIIEIELIENILSKYEIRSERGDWTGIVNPRFVAIDILEALEHNRYQFTREVLYELIKELDRPRWFYEKELEALVWLEKDLIKSREEQ
jgi:hypothetical protein